ncbi:hypothetical protein ERUR111494_05725 [Erysipelothrix urinaevulpis]|uniref:hypothetical protein n=1 Tax=Erysipelothrix urinaevulpis TaxID=2683717 RepID=UPI00135A1006|nr:hypothetical protein [Erysipelothrix urinaevulpis]
MNKTHDYYLTSILIILSLLVGVFTLHTSSLLTTGIGFGKDTRYIVYTEQEQILDHFLLHESKNLREIRKTNISDSTYLVTVSGVEQLSDYKDRIETIDAKLKVIVMGSFGSITKLKNNESFVATYFLVFFLVLLVYFSRRFKLMGYLSSLELISLVIGSLYFNQKMGYPYTKMLWYAVLISMIIIIFFEQYFLSEFEGQNLEDVLKSNKFLKGKYLHVQGGIALLFAFVAQFTFSLESFSFYSVAGFMGALSALLILRVVIQRFVTMPLLVYCAKRDQRQDNLDFVDDKIVNVKNQSRTIYLLGNIGLSLLLIITLTLGFMTQWDALESEDYTNQNVMILNRSDANTYLQLQALLHREGLYQQQKSYEVSEQEDLWIKFSDKLPFNDLESISKIVGEEMAVSVTYYNTSSATNPLGTLSFYKNLLIYLGASLLLYWTFFDLKKVWIQPAVSIMSLLAFVTLIIGLQIEWSLEIVFVTWSIPMIVSTVLIIHNNIFKDDRHVHQIVKMTGINFLILLIMAIPVFVIIPTDIAVEMVGILALMLVSVHMGVESIYLAKCLLRKVVGNAS